MARVPWPRIRRVGIAIAAFAAVAAASIAPARENAASTGPRLLRGAASAEHLWFVTQAERGDGEGRLLHHAADMDGPYVSAQPIDLSREPEAVAAHGNRVWLVFPPTINGEVSQRSVFTQSVQRDAALEIYRTSPRDRLQIVEALPGGGRLVGFTATSRGPVALIVPPSHELIETADEAGEAQGDAGGEEGDEREAAEPTTIARGGVLLHLRGDRWRELTLPSDFNPASRTLLAVCGSDRAQLCLLQEHSANRSQAILNRRVMDEDETWSRETVEIDVQQVLSVQSVRGRLLAMTQEPRAESYRLQYVRPTVVLDLAEVPLPRGRWGVFGMKDGLRMIEHSTRDGTTMRRIDPVTGEVGEARSVTTQPLPTERVWYTSFLLAMAVLAVVLVLLVRPSRQQSIDLPDDLGILPPIPRLLALLMDLFPGGVVAMLALRGSPLDLLRLPIMTDSLELAAPFLLMVGVTFVHCTITEIVKGTTLGKAFLGAKVITTNGEHPGAMMVLARNAVKVLILLVPVLAIFALLNPNLQGFDDLVARTVVVGHVRDSNSGTSEETEEKDGQRSGDDGGESDSS